MLDQGSIKRAIEQTFYSDCVTGGKQENVDLATAATLRMDTRNFVICHRAVRAGVVAEDGHLMVLTTDGIMDTTAATCR